MTKIIRGATAASISPRPDRASSGQRSGGRQHTGGLTLFRSVSGRGRSAPTWSSTFRPNFTPRRCAAFTPARVRSEISDLSSSARTPIICHMARPVGVAVSIASVSEWNFTPRARRSSSIVIRSRRLRPSRSSFHTIRVSPCSSFFRQQGRALGRGPDTPSSLKTVRHPAFLSAASCKAGFWSSVESGRSRIS